MDTVYSALSSVLDRAAAAHAKNPRPPQPEAAVALMREMACEALTGEGDNLLPLFVLSHGGIELQRHAAALYYAERARLLQGGAS